MEIKKTNKLAIYVNHGIMDWIYKTITKFITFLIHSHDYLYNDLINTKNIYRKPLEIILLEI